MLVKGGVGAGAHDLLNVRFRIKGRDVGIEFFLGNGNKLDGQNNVSSPFPVLGLWACLPTDVKSTWRA